jgi:hypothetical protein
MLLQSLSLRGEDSSLVNAPYQVQQSQSPLPDQTAPQKKSRICVAAKKPNNISNNSKLSKHCSKMICPQINILQTCDGNIIQGQDEEMKLKILPFFCEYMNKE